MKKVSLLFVASAIAVGSAYACGGGEPAKNPTDVTSASASGASSTTDMPSATATATASATVTATASTPPAPEAPPLAIDGIKITGKTKDGKPVAVEVKADGTVNGTKDGKPMLLATFVKNEIKDDKGATVFVVAADGKLSSPMAMNGGSWTFNDKDDLMLDGKPAIVIGDDGTPALTNAGKTEKAPFKFEKLPPKSKRAAVVLVAYMLMARATTTTGPTAASVTVVPSAKPSAAPSAKPAH